MLQRREPGGERRRYERFDLGLPVSFEYEFGGEPQKERGRFINVSAGGAFLHCKNCVSTGTELQLRIDAPSGRLTRPRAKGDRESSPPLRIRTRGEVIRTERDPEVPESCFVAVEFTSPLRILRGTERAQPP